MKPRFYWVLLLLVALVGCRDTPVAFDAPAILRGVWEGEIYDYPNTGERMPIRLEATATYHTERDYLISGTFTLGSQSPQAISGEGSGSGYTFIRPATPAPWVGFVATVPSLSIQIRGRTTNPNEANYNLTLEADCPAASPSCSLLGDKTYRAFIQKIP